MVADDVSVGDVIHGGSRDEVTRHRCGVPELRRGRRGRGRPRRIGGRFECSSCCTVYRLECSPFGLEWRPVMSTSPIVVDVVHDRPPRHDWSL